MKHIRRILSIILALALTVTVPAFAANITENKLLYLTATQEDIDNITAAHQVSELTYLADLVVFDESQADTFETYSAIALPYDLATQIDLAKLFGKGVRVYLYGNVSVSDYSNAVGSSLESKRIVNDIGDSGTVKRVTQTVEDIGIEYAVIGWTNSDAVDRGLLCTFDCDGSDTPPFYYFKAVCNNFKKVQNSITPYSVELIDQHTDYVSYYNDANSVTYMDWYLSKDIGERNPNADYYAVATHVWASTDMTGGEIKNVGIKNSVIQSGDELFDCAPANTAALKGGSISVDLMSGSVSASINLSSDPQVTRNADYTNDTVEWTFYKGVGWNPPGLDNDTFKTLFVWSTTSNRPSLKIEYRSLTQRGNAPPIYQAWRTVRVSLS
jgi:hypothetical protein